MDVHNGSNDVRKQTRYSYSLKIFEGTLKRRCVINIALKCDECLDNKNAIQTSLPDISQSVNTN